MPSDGNQIAKTESVGSTVNVVTSYTYDDLGRLTQESATDYTVTPNTVLTTDYTYDEFGNRKTKTTGGITTTYYYDLNNRLTSEVTGTVTTEYDYDENGNQISKKVGTDPAELNEYDFFGRLVDANGATYTYSPDDLRRTKTISGTTTQFVWNGQNMVAELNSGGTVQALYRYGINLISSTVSGTTKYYIYNAHGDVVQLANSTGAVVKTYHYDAFGNEVSPDAADNNPFRYCGQYFDKETGTYYLRARYYDPAIGRFISQDGMGYIDDKDPLTLNLYTYCAGNPVRYIDLNGHSFETYMFGFFEAFWEGLIGYYPYPYITMTEMDLESYYAGRITGDIVVLLLTTLEMTLSLAMIVNGINAMLGSGALALALTSTGIGAPVGLLAAGIAVAGAAVAVSGVVIAADGIVRGVSTIKALAADIKGYREFDKQRKGTPGNNQAQNKAARDAANRYNLTPEQRRKLHDEITGQDFTFQEIEQIAEDIAKGRSVK